MRKEQKSGTWALWKACHWCSLHIFDIFSESVTEQRHQNMKCQFYMIKKQKTVILRHQLKCERYLTYYTKWNVPSFKLTSCLSLVLVVPIGRMSLPLSRIFLSCGKISFSAQRGDEWGNLRLAENPRPICLKIWDYGFNNYLILFNINTQRRGV